MPVHIICDQCRATLALKEEYAGRQVRCPKCQHVLTAPGEPAAAQVTATPPAPRPPVSTNTTAAPPLPPPFVPVPTTVVPLPNDVAGRSVAQWQTALPTYLESVYVPSGRTSLEAVGYMAAMVIPAIVGGWIVTALALFVTWALCAGLFQLMMWMIQFTERLLFILPIMISLFALLGYCLSCVAGGFAVAGSGDSTVTA